MKTKQALEALGALAQPSRLAVFRLLVSAAPAGVAAGEIARRVRVPGSTMSAHLAILSRAGLIAGRRESRTIYYSLEVEGVRALFDFLAADCCGGKPELCAPLTAFVSGATQTCKPPAKKTRRQ
ncbi:MAG TPA: metalloregulator ArsR/SmtB family transcription factor [Caulobacterales bacterium]|nr:metalloregulator ArsR/SmtB family transcription factor [Caulobacterales bacterium]